MNTDKKRKISKIVLISILIFIVGGYLGIKHLQRASPIFNFFFSPNDLYKSLVCTDFNLSENKSYQLEFKNKYPGNHKLAILVDRPTDVSGKYKTKFKIRMDIKSEGTNTVIKSDLTENNIWPFWGTPNNTGFAIFTYKVPVNLPQGKTLTASIHVEEPDVDFTNTYGKQRLCFSKYSDE